MRVRVPRACGEIKNARLSQQKALVITIQVHFSNMVRSLYYIPREFSLLRFLIPSMTGQPKYYKKFPPSHTYFCFLINCFW